MTRTTPKMDSFRHSSEHNPNHEDHHAYQNLLLVNVDKIYIHQNFTRTEFFRNDIALLR